MRPRERGATFLGIVIILLILGSALYAGIRLVPVYLEYTKVARSLEQVRDEHAAIDTGLVRGVPRIRQENLDQLFAFLGIGIHQEGARLVGGGNAAHQVEVQPA